MLVRPLVWTVALALATAARPAAADCADEAAAIRARLVRDAARARTWNYTWAAVFGASAAGQLGLALAHANPLGDANRAYLDTLYVGAAKASLGAASRLTVPLRGTLPAPSADACADRDALHASEARLARAERQTFWLGHAGAIAVNGAGAIVLGVRDSWGTALASVAIGYPVGLLAVYTMPRASWHVAATPTPGGVALSVAGAF